MNTISTARAAIVTLAFTLGFWVLDFAAATGPEWLKALGEISPTQALKAFEHGLFSAAQVLGLAVLGLGLTALAAVVLPPGLSGRVKLARTAVATGVLSAALVVTTWVGFAVDVTEDCPNSFNPALVRMDQGLVITLYLTPEDSRAREYVSNVLAKLKCLVPGLTVHWAAVGKAGLFGAAPDDRYGIIVYDYDGRHAESRSNSLREILPLLHELAGVKVTPVDLPPYSGYPLVAEVWTAELWFYGLLPLLILSVGWCFYRAGRLPCHLRRLKGES